MIIESIKYTRYEGTPLEWSIEDKNKEPAIFGNINLLVGKNSVGKSRIITVLNNISLLLSEKLSITDHRYPSFMYYLSLKEDCIRYEYCIEVSDFAIINESLKIDGIEKYNRQKDLIFSKKTKKNESLTLKEGQLITSLRNQCEDFPYINEIFEWSNALKCYTFTNQFEKNTLLDQLEDHNQLLSQNNLNIDNIITLFSIGKQKFGNDFIDPIISDMQQIGYEINDIDLLKHPKGIGLSVKEEELPMPILQTDMSQGMFRALSFIIQLNYALVNKTSMCLLIDDLGEGLDFSRSKSLIDIIIHKLNNSYIQLFITTNDRYIMNKIPLRYWTVIQRMPKLSILYNYSNSKEIFDDFKYTGLNNFDFLATDFYLHGFDNQQE